jgi:hypothetical protein
MLKTKRSTRFFIVLVHLIGSNNRVSRRRRRTTTTTSTDETIVSQINANDNIDTNTNSSKKRIRTRIQTPSSSSSSDYGYVESILPEWFLTAIGVRKHQRRNGHRQRRHKPRIVIESIDLYNYHHHQQQEPNESFDPTCIRNCEYDDNDDEKCNFNSYNNDYMYSRNQFITPGVGVDAYQQYHTTTSTTTIPSKKEKNRGSSSHSRMIDLDDDNSSIPTTGTTMIVWLQQSNDDVGLCLDPTGYFSECGDTTLWQISSIPLLADYSQPNNPTTSSAVTSTTGSSRDFTSTNDIQQQPKYHHTQRTWKQFFCDTVSDATLTSHNSRRHSHTQLTEQQEADVETGRSNSIDNDSLSSQTAGTDFGWTFQVLDDDIYNWMLQNQHQQQQQSQQKTQHSPSMSPGTATSSNDDTRSAECLRYNIPSNDNPIDVGAEIDVSVCTNHPNEWKDTRRRRIASRVAPLPFALPTSLLTNDNTGTTNNNLNSNVWFVNANGNLQIIRKQSSLVDVSIASSLCLGRQLATSEAILVPCAQDSTVATTSELVQFSFVQYRMATIPKTKTNPSSNDVGRNKHKCSTTKSTTAGNHQSMGGNHLHRRRRQQHHDQQQQRRRQRKRRQARGDDDDDSSNLPHNRDYASIRSNADVHTLNPTLALAKRIRYDNLHNSNPILFVSAASASASSSIDSISSSSSSVSSKPPTSAMNVVMSMRPSSSTGSNSRNSMTMMMMSTGRNYPSTNNRYSSSTTNTKENEKKPDNNKGDDGTVQSPLVVVSSPSAASVSSSSVSSTTAGKIQHHRIYRHPYIDAATKNNIWTDTQTGLEYNTDLTDYLKFDRQEYGRHTLTGVGIYRKGYVIKVYGIAFYVSKRDVLADPSFLQYAGMSASELQKRPDFYQLLRTMGDGTTTNTATSDNPNNNNNNVGRFDRTIMLKTNMQLSAETMRSSLQADWSYLTEEMKSTLIGSSMEPRPADDEMIQLINSSDNPSRCSCSQVAPPEHNGNPDCCARGTELSFTWLKNDYLQVRITKHSPPKPIFQVVHVMLILFANLLFFFFSFQNVL